MLEFYFPEWAWVIVNLVLLTLLLKRILWKPVGRILDERQAKITQALADAEAVRADRLALETGRAALEAELDQKTARQMQEARVRAGREFDRIVAEAEEKARAILSSAQAQAEREREGVLRAARAEVVSAALELAGALMGAQMSSDQNARLVESFLAQRFGEAKAAGKGAT